MMIDAVEAIERRRRLVRIILLGVIFATMPLYCLGFVLWGTAPAQNIAPTSTATATGTPIGGGLTNTPQPTVTIIVTTTLENTLLPTPINPIFPTSLPPTRFLTATSIFPTSTTPPTLTPIPSNTNPPPTNTFLPPPTDTPIPTTAFSASPTQPPPSATSLPTPTVGATIGPPVSPTGVSQ